MKTFFLTILYMVMMVAISYQIFGPPETVPEWEPIKQLELSGESLYSLPVIARDDPEFNCLAENIYHEARNQSIDGMVAVGAVTINRRKSVKYPNTICEVVYDPYQFSWVNDETVIEITNPIDEKAWETAQEIALMVLNDGIPYDMLGVYHYHADYVLPEWALAKLEHKKIDNHIFYRM
jgi:spore germination cell wall hydrolase CwlJ-like protein